MPKEIKLPLSDYLDRIKDMWCLLPSVQQELFCAHAVLLSYKKNEEIYSEGACPEYLLCVLSGKIKIFRDGIGGAARYFMCCGLASIWGIGLLWRRSLILPQRRPSSLLFSVLYPCRFLRICWLTTPLCVISLFVIWR